MSILAESLHSTNFHKDPVHPPILECCQFNCMVALVPKRGMKDPVFLQCSSSLLMHSQNTKAELSILFQCVAVAGIHRSNLTQFESRSPSVQVYVLVQNRKRPCARINARPVVIATSGLFQSTVCCTVEHERPGDSAMSIKFIIAHPKQKHKSRIKQIFDCINCMSGTFSKHQNCKKHQNE